MSAQQHKPGKFGTQVRVRSDIWYSERPGPRGGASKTVQVLLTPEQAKELADAIREAADE